MNRTIASLRERLPSLSLSRRLFVRALWVWLLGRLFFEAASALPAGRLPVPPMSLTLPGVTAFAAITAALALVDVARRNERLLIANLGVRLYVVAAIGALAALAGETVIRIAIGPGE